MSKISSRNAGSTVSSEAIRQWCKAFGPDDARTLRRRRGRMGDIWHLDELFVTIQGRRHVSEGLVLPTMIGVIDEAHDRSLQFPRTVGVLQLHHVLHRPVRAFELALGHRVIRGAARVPERVRVERGRELLRDGAWAGVT